MSLAFLIAGTLIVSNSELPAEVASLILSICLYVPMALVMFSVPSTYAYYGVKPKNVDAIVEYLERLGIQEIETVDCLQSNLENINNRVNFRISAYKWLVGASWALFTLILNQQMNVALKMTPGSLQGAIQENFIALAAFIGISTLAIWIIASYKRASELLIKTLEFGFVDIKHKLHMAKDTQQSH